VTETGGAVEVQGKCRPIEQLDPAARLMLEGTVLADR
jgi:hypothetical protein